MEEKDLCDSLEMGAERKGMVQKMVCYKLGALIGEERKRQNSNHNRC